ncbi:MAG: hypothetical protein ABIV13_03750 [Fimbriimonadales bacterium]
MKRKKNGLLVGTILVLLVGALIFIQARNQEPEDDHGDPGMSGPTSPGGAPAGPRVDEHLDNPTPGRGPVPAPN